MAIPGWVNLDIAALPGVDVVADIERCAEAGLPFAADAFDGFLMSHVVEHIRNVLPLMTELHRIARPGASLMIRVPFGGSDDAWEDPTHVRPYFLNSFGYFSQPFYWRADYGYRGDWQPERITLRIAAALVDGLTPQAVMEKVQTGRNVVREMVAELVAVKPVRAADAALQRAPRYIIDRIAPPATSPGSPG